MKSVLFYQMKEFCLGGQMAEWLCVCVVQMTPSKLQFPALSCGRIIIIIIIIITITIIIIICSGFAPS